LPMRTSVTQFGNGAVIGRKLLNIVVGRGSIQSSLHKPRYPCVALPSAPSSCAYGRLCSVAMVCSQKVLNYSSVSEMVSGSSFSKSPLRLQRRFLLSLRSCSFCSWISRMYGLWSYQILVCFT